MEPAFFATPGAFREWLETHHATAPELVVGYYRKTTGRPSLTWAESVDEALCFGWIDGVRRGHDTDAFTIRFTPRRRGSIWSAINVAKVEELTRQGRMRPAGLAAFAERRADRTGIYSFEQATPPALDPTELALFRADEPAFAFFSASPAGYRRTATWWVVSAKRPETRARRLTQLIADSAAGNRLRHLTRSADRPTRP